METRLTMKQLPESERPYEKMEKFGAGALSDAELLSVILRSGTPKEKVSDIALRVLHYAGEHSELPGLAALFSLSPAQLCQIPGIGRVKSLQIGAVLEIASRLQSASRISVMQAQDPQSVAEVYMPAMRYLRTEQIRVLYLNHHHQLIFEEKMDLGQTAEAFLPEQHILKTALEHHTSGLILLHNHPGGDPEPSQADVSATSRLALSLRTIGIRLLDHIIIGDGMFYSMMEQGLLSTDI